MENSPQAWKMRFSYRNATIVVCFFNLLMAVLILRAFLAAAPNRRLRPDQPDPELVRYMLECEEMRRAMEPVELIRRLKELEQDADAVAESGRPLAPKRTAAADLSKRLQDFRAMNDANNQKALEEWRKRKIERDRARQRGAENNTTGGKSRCQCEAHLPPKQCIQAWSKRSAIVVPIDCRVVSEDQPHGSCFDAVRVGYADEPVKAAMRRSCRR